ncbi:MAG: D-alanyl-D-alanine carboxypeptidase family protein [Streptosporangiaceae bacterium]
MQTPRKAGALLAAVIAATAATGVVVGSDSRGLPGHVHRSHARGTRGPAPAWGPPVQMTADQMAGAGGQRAGRPARPPDDQVGGPLLASHGIVVRQPGRGSRPLPGVPASAYVIADAGTGQVLAAKDPHGLFPPASTLKVLTAITMLPLLSPDAIVTASKRAASVEPNIVGLVPGHRYRVADLFRALLLISANDAAVALVEASGSFTHGMALVNAEAHHLQAYGVVAKYPNGLPAAGQVVSAYDLALIGRAALGLPAFMQYDSLRTARFAVSSRKKVTLINQNYLLTRYRGGIGGKIGWTSKAGATYIGLARRHGVTLIVTILHATPLTEITSAEKLLNWGFGMDGKVSAVGTLVPPLAPVRTAAQPQARQTTQPQARQAGHHMLATDGTLGSPARGGQRSAELTASIAGGLCAIVLAGLTWLRRKAMAGKPPAGGPAG